MEKPPPNPEQLGYYSAGQMSTYQRQLKAYQNRQARRKALASDRYSAAFATAVHKRP